MIVDEKKYNIIVIEDNLGDFFLLEEYLNEKIENPTLFHFERFNDLNNFQDKIKPSKINPKKFRDY